MPQRLGFSRGRLRRARERDLRCRRRSADADELNRPRWSSGSRGRLGIQGREPLLGRGSVGPDATDSSASTDMGPDQQRHHFGHPQADTPPTFNTCTGILNMYIQHLHRYPQHVHSTPAQISSTCTFNTCTDILNMYIQHLHRYPQHVHSTPAQISSTCTFNTCTDILDMYACRIPTGTGAQRARRSSRPRPAGSLPGGLCQGPVGSAQWRTVELPVRGQRNCPVVAFAAVPPRPLAEDLVHPSPCMHRQEENQAPVRPHRDLTQLRLRLRIGRRHRGRPPRTNGRPLLRAVTRGRVL